MEYLQEDPRMGGTGGEYSPPDPQRKDFLVGDTIRNHTSANGLWSVTKRVEVDVTKRVVRDHTVTTRSGFVTFTLRKFGYDH